MPRTAFLVAADAWSRCRSGRADPDQFGISFAKLKGLWYGFGGSDGFALIEAPDNVTSASISIAITASGAFRKYETTVLMTQDELLNALKKAQDVAYVAPGTAVHA